MDIALGNLFTVIVANKLLNNDAMNLPTGKKPHATLPPSSINGTGGLNYVFANCCHPIPGDQIVAHVNPGKGLVIHTSNCANLKTSNPNEQFLPVSWDMNNACNEVFEAGLRIEMINTQGMIGEISNTISVCGANISQISSETKEGQVYILNLVITVRDRLHLANIIRKIKSMNNINRVVRRKG